mmetsp:Transcript_12233/g.34615  ORF Transcript_12233/g.34615 Transcript_12233/m.34615 type:complete len:334 (+) Transcript_12233:743-1744(+)
MRVCDARNRSSRSYSCSDFFDRIFITNVVRSAPGASFRLQMTTFPPLPSSCRTWSQQYRSKIFWPPSRRRIVFSGRLGLGQSWPRGAAAGRWHWRPERRSHSEDTGPGWCCAGPQPRPSGHAGLRAACPRSHGSARRGSARAAAEARSGPPRTPCGRPGAGPPPRSSRRCRCCASTRRPWGSRRGSRRRPAVPSGPTWRGPPCCASSSPTRCRGCSASRARCRPGSSPRCSPGSPARPAGGPAAGRSCCSATRRRPGTSGRLRAGPHGWRVCPWACSGRPTRSSPAPGPGCATRRGCAPPLPRRAASPSSALSTPWATGAASVCQVASASSTA